MTKTMIITSKTKQKAIRFPLWMVRLIEQGDTATKSAVELIELGLIAKHGKGFVDNAKSK